MKAKFASRVISLIAAAALTLSMGIAAVSAAPADSQVFDDYNRTGETGQKGDGDSLPFWLNVSPITCGSFDNGALKLDYKKDLWYGEGKNVIPADYKYMVIRIKGAKGGEGVDIVIRNDQMVENDIDSVPFVDLVGPDGNKVPEITTEYQDIVVDMAASGFLADTSYASGAGFQALHMNFPNDTEGTVWIDEIYFTNNADNASGGSSNNSTPADNSTPSKDTTSNPATGDAGVAAVAAAWLVACGAVAFTLKKRSSK